MVHVMRVRCNKCEKNFTLVTESKAKPVNGQGMGVTCKDIRAHYKAAGGCDSELVFYRSQGHRVLKKTDVVLEKLLPVKPTDKKVGT